MYRFYFGEIMLPVAPGKITTSISGKNKTYTLINEGEIIVPKLPGLAGYKFKALLPNQFYPFAEYPDGYHPGGYYLDMLERLAADCKPFRFRMLRTYGQDRQIDWSIDAQVSLEKYTVEESAENGLDFVVDIELKRCPNWGTKTLTIKNGTASSTPSRDPSPIKEKNIQYTIKDGDTLWGIAARFLTGSRYHEIYTANKKVLDDEAARRGKGSEMGERWIFTGTTITLPAG